MKYFLLLLITISFLYSKNINIDSFKANFVQTLTNDKGNSLVYKGVVVASKPQNMLWNYTYPAKKDIIIKEHKVTVIEYDIEQVQIRNIHGNFNFFKILKNAKKVKDNIYIAKFNNIEYKLNFKNNEINSISYLDELENNISITFTKQEENKKIDINIFTPLIPLDFDIIQE